MAINDCDSWNQECPFGLHHFDIFAVDSVSVLDGVYPGGERVLDTLGSGGMRGDFAVLFVGLFHNDRHFLDGERRVHPVGVDFDQVGTIAELFADGPAGFVDTADHLGAGGEVVQIRRNSKRIVLPHRRDRPRRHLHPRSQGETLIDGVSQCDIGVASAFVFDVAYRRISGFQGYARVIGAFERAERL